MAFVITQKKWSLPLIKKSQPLYHNHNPFYNSLDSTSEGGKWNWPSKMWVPSMIEQIFLEKAIKYWREIFLFEMLLCIQLQTYKFVMEQWQFVLSSKIFEKPQTVGLQESKYIFADFRVILLHCLFFVPLVLVITALCH